MLFIFCISITCGQFLPHARGRILHIHWADIALWTGRKLHPVWNLQKDAVRLIPSLTDAGNQSGIFQLPQGGLDRPLTPVKIVRHLLDRIDHIYIAVLVCPPGALGKLGSAEEQPIEQLCIDGIFASRYEARQRDKRRQRGSQFVKDDASLPSRDRTYRYSSSLCRTFSSSQISACRAFSSATSSS